MVIAPGVEQSCTIDIVTRTYIYLDDLYGQIYFQQGHQAHHGCRVVYLHGINEIIPVGLSIFAVGDGREGCARTGL